MGGKFNPARATRADFNEVFETVQEGIPALERQMSAIRAEMTAKYSLLYEEVQNACGEYRNLGERLDAGDDALNAEESARTAADTSEAAARAAADTKHDAALVELIDSGAKNTIDLSSIASQTINGITWTVDADSGTVTANGTATADSFFFILPRDSNIEYTYPTVLSGCPAGGSQSIYEIQAQIGSTSYRDFGSKANVPAGVIRYIACAVRKNQVVSDLVFRPMLDNKAADAISDAFVPYCPPPVKMYAMIKALQSGSGTQAVTQAQLTSLRPVAGLTTDTAAPEDTEVLDDA